MIICSFTLINNLDTHLLFFLITIKNDIFYKYTTTFYTYSIHFTFLYNFICCKCYYSLYIFTYCNYSYCKYYRYYQTSFILTNNDKFFLNGNKYFLKHNKDTDFVSLEGLYVMACWSFGY